jgi:uncharacterized protein (TIGR00288 family)
MLATTELSLTVGTGLACDAFGVPLASYHRRRKPKPLVPQPLKPRRSPRRLTVEERGAVLAALNSERFVDCSPSHVYATLLDDGVSVRATRPWPFLDRFRSHMLSEMPYAILVDGPNLLHGLRAFHRGERNLGDALRGLKAYFGEVSRAVIFIDTRMAQRPAVMHDIATSGFETRLVQRDLDMSLAAELQEIAHATKRIVLVSGDAGFAAPVTNATRQGARVTVVALTPALSQQLAATGAEIIDIIEMLVAATKPGQTQVARRDIDADDAEFLRSVSAQSVRTLRAIEAGVTLERELRRLCLRHGIVVAESAGISVMNDALVKHNVYSKLMHKKISVWAEIRNNAAHGLPPQYTTVDINQMEDGVREFIQNHSA